MDWHEENKERGFQAKDKIVVRTGIIYFSLGERMEIELNIYGRARALNAARRGYEWKWVKRLSNV